jgi:hypothetical protein
MEKIFHWDGSHIGKLSNNNIIEYKNYDNLEIIFLNDSGEKYTAIITKYTNSIALVIDELKPLFGIEKFGRHSCYINKSKKILTLIKNNYKPFTPDSIISLKSSLRNDIRQSYVFRYITGLTYNIDKSLWYVNGKITSYYENKIDFNKSDITKTCFNKWFLDDWNDVVKILKKIVGKNIMFFKFKIDEIILRVDKNYIQNSNEMIKRIEQLFI